ncbi:MAG TPA: hypothetical protein VGK97_14265 [Spongiibacteraceae bacterium]
MSSASNVINLAEYRETNSRELIDDISARAFLFLRDEAEAEDLQMHEVIAEHMYGMALVVQAVEGKTAAKNLLAAIAEKLS